MRRKDIAAFFGILCYTLTVFAGLYVYYKKLQCFMERYVKQKAKDTGRKQNEKSIV